jgi:hypothetical protein
MRRVFQGVTVHMVRERKWRKVNKNCQAPAFPDISPVVPHLTPAAFVGGSLVITPILQIRRLRQALGLGQFCCW